VKSESRTSYRRQLWDVAVDNYGYITTRMAVGVGVPAVELPKLAARGGLDRVGHGIYRFEDLPSTDRDQFMEAVLQGGEGAFLYGDAVLSLLDLAQVNPRVIRVGIPRRARIQFPGYMEAKRMAVEPHDLTTYEGIPSTTVGRALLDCRTIVMAERLEAAVEEATQRGLLTRLEKSRVSQLLGATS